MVHFYLCVWEFTTHEELVITIRIWPDSLKRRITAFVKIPSLYTILFGRWIISFQFLNSVITCLFFFFFFTDYFCSLKGSHKTQTICFFINILKIFCMNLVKSLHKVSYNNCTLVKTGSRTMWYWKRINPRKTRGKKITVCIDDKFRTYMKLALKSWS